MAPKVPGLFANPTTGIGGIGEANLNQARLNLQNYKAPELDRARIESLAKSAGGFQAKQQQKAQGINLGGLAEEFGIDVTQPSFDQTADSDGGLGGFWNDTMEAAEAGYGDMGFGASLILNDNETNMLALEQNYQRMKAAPPEELGLTPPATAGSSTLIGSQMYWAAHCPLSAPCLRVAVLDLQPVPLFPVSVTSPVH